MMGSMGLCHEGYAAIGDDIDSHDISEFQLSARHEIRQREDDIPLDGPLQMASPVLRARTLGQQKAFDAFRAIEDKFVRARSAYDAPVHRPQFNVQEPPRMLR